MKKQFAREAHNRQDKTHKLDYSEGLPPRQNVSWSGMNPSENSSGAYLITIALDFSELNPRVAKALESFKPEIDFKRLIDALQAEAGRHRSTFQRTTLKMNSERIALEERKLLSALAHGTLPGRFFWWHERQKDRKLATVPAIPKEFHDWLRKFANKQNKIITDPSTPPSTPSADGGYKPTVKQSVGKLSARIFTTQT